MRVEKRVTDTNTIREMPRSLRKECTRSKWAIVLGGAECVWDDVRQFTYGTLAEQWPGLYVAANDIGSHWGPLDHWATFHVQKLMKWIEDRKQNGLAPAPVTWGWRPGQPVDFVCFPWAGGSSGMLATQVAMLLGCTKVILCGMPMTGTPHFAESREFDAAHTIWSESDGHWRNWLRVHSFGWFEDKVRSMSGRTRELFGEPTKEWLLT